MRGRGQKDGHSKGWKRWKTMVTATINRKKGREYKTWSRDQQIGSERVEKKLEKKN